MKAQTKTLSKKQINAAIRKANAAYKKATPEQRRVMLARDARKEIEKGRYNVDQGTFVRLPFDFYDDVSAQLQPLLHDPQQPACTVCADGALFLSAIRFRNDCTVGHADSLDNRLPTELKEFSAAQRRLIEIAFEEGCGFYGVERGQTGDGDEFIPTEADKQAAAWSGEHGLYDDTERLLAILTNIIRNKGTFKPTEK